MKAAWFRRRASNLSKSMSFEQSLLRTAIVTDPRSPLKSTDPLDQEPSKTWPDR